MIDFIEYLAPIPEQQEMHSLQYMSSCVLTSSRDIMEIYVQDIPPVLFPVLFQSVIQHVFSVKKGQPKKALFCDSVATLLHYWPYESLILKDLLVSARMPKLPQSNHVSLSGNYKRFLSCAEEIVEVMLKAFLYERNTKNQSGREKKLCTLDISGIGINLDKIITHPKVEFNSQSSKSVHPQKQKLFSRKLVCDITLNESDHSNFSYYLTLMNCPRKKDRDSPGVVAVFDKVKIENVQLNTLNTVIKPVIIENVNLHHLEVGFSEISQNLLEEIAHCKYDKLEGLYIAYCNSVGGFSRLRSGYDFNFFKSFENLHYLDVSGCTSDDDWSVLGELSAGLTYLKMVGCRIKSNGLNCIGKRHGRYLRHLDISENRMDGDWFPAFLNLIGLLNKIEILEMEACGLSGLTVFMLEAFIKRIRATCPLLSVLQILNNDFSVSFFRNDLFSLIYKPSLRLLCITIPSYMYISDDYNTIHTEINRLKNDLLYKIKISKESKLQIEWNEKPEHSRWFYSVV